MRRSCQQLRLRNGRACVGSRRLRTSDYMIRLMHFSRAVPTAVGRTTVYHRPQGAVGVQRIALHQLGNLQRDATVVLPQRHNVSIFACVIAVVIAPVTQPHFRSETFEFRKVDVSVHVL
jgi:hypothetical protein